MAEHLGVENGVLEQCLEREGNSLIRAIETLRSKGGSLIPFEAPELNRIEASFLEENQLLDPERPSSRWRGLRHGFTSLLSGTGGP